MQAAASAPIWLIIVAQGISTVGDAFGQRCSRIHFRGSRRHFFIGVILMNAVSLAIILGIAQLALPRSITGAVYVNGVEIPCYREIDVEHNWSKTCDNVTCTQVQCPRQGVTTSFTMLYHAPLILLAGVVNWFVFKF